MDSATEIDQLLAALLTPNNEIIQMATARIKTIGADPSCIELFANAACTIHEQDPSGPGKRQLAAVLLRQRIVRLWMKLPTSSHTALKNMLLQATVVEPVPIVSHSLARVVSVIAKFDLPNNKWKELLPFLFQCVSEGNTLQRLVGMYILSQLCETVGKHLAFAFDKLFEVLVRALADTESVEVTLFAVDVASSLIPFLEGAHISKFRVLIPSICTVVRGYMGLFPDNGGDESQLLRAMEVFDNLLDVEELKISGEEVKGLVTFFIEVAHCQALGHRIRSKALFFLQTVAHNRKKLMVKSGMIGPCVEQLLGFMSEEPSEEDLEDEAAGGVLVGSQASKVLDSMAMDLPSEPLLQAAFPLIQPYATSQSEFQRRAAQKALGDLAEGCSYLLGESPEMLREILGVVNSGMRDTSLRVREAAYFTLAVLSVHVQPAMCNFTVEVLPELYAALKDEQVQSNEELRDKSMFALECFCENLKGDQIQPFIEPLMERLQYMLYNGNSEIQERAISIIGAAAQSAGAHFNPYYAPVCQYILQIMQQPTSLETMSVRVQATDMAGTLADCVSVDVFQSQVDLFVTAALHGLEEYGNDTELRQATVGMFGTFAQRLGDGFFPYLETVIPYVLASSICEDGLVRRSSAEDGERAVNFDDEEEEDGDNDEYDELPAYVSEKETAVNALGVFAEFCTAAFLPHFEQSVRIILQLREHGDPDIRKACMYSLCQHVCGLSALAHRSTVMGPVYVGEKPISIAVSTAKKLADTIVPILLNQMQVDTDIKVANTIAECLAHMLRAEGSAEALLEQVQAYNQVVAASLDGQIACFAAVDEEMMIDDEGEEHSEYELLVKENCADIIVALSATYGALFADSFGHYLDLLFKNMKKSCHVSVRSVMTGTIGECVTTLGAAVGPHVARILPVLIQTMKSDPEGEVRSNAAYGSGVICEHAPREANPFYSELLKTLYPLFFNQPLLNITDNAAGAVSRMIVAAPHSIPLDQVLPTLVGALPLKIDFSETLTVVKCLTLVLEQFFSSTGQTLGGILHYFAHLRMHEEQIEDPSAAELMRAALVAIYNAQRETVEAVIAASLDETHRNALQLYFQ